MEDWKLIKAVKSHFSGRNNILPKEVKVAIEDKNAYGNIYRVQYLDKDKLIEGMDGYFEDLYNYLNADADLT